MASVEDGYLVMAYGSADAMKLFADKLAAVYADAQTLVDEAIVS